MGVRDLPGGIVITGGVTKLDGIAQLARHILKSRVRIYTPDYIGVREPTYTTAVGLIRYAHMMKLILVQLLMPRLPRLSKHLQQLILVRIDNLKEIKEINLVYLIGQRKFSINFSNNRLL